MPIISLEYAVRLKKEAQRYERPSEHIDEIYDRMRGLEEEDKEKIYREYEKQGY